MDEIKLRGVYRYIFEGRTVYIGSSCCGLSRVESNHRGWRSKGYSSTNFRRHLVDDYKEGQFHWLIKPAPRTQEEVETLERDLIRALDPELNIDYDPVSSSKKYGRY